MFKTVSQTCKKLQDEKLSLASKANNNTALKWLLIAAAIIGMWIGKGCR